MNTIASFITIAASGPSLSIPGPYWLFTLLHWLTLTLHFVAMNFLFGGVMLMILSKTSAYRKLLFFENLKSFPVAMAATITLGVAPLLFVQVMYGQFFYGASIISAWNWYFIIPVVLVVYYSLYSASILPKLSDGNRIKLLIVALVGFVYVSLTFTMISDLAIKPYLWEGLYQSSPAGTHLNPSWGQVLFRWAHMISGALAVAGICIQAATLLIAKVKGNRDLIKFGGKMFLLGTLKATLFGVIYLFTLEPAVLKGFLQSPGMHVMLTSIVLNIVLAFLVYRSSITSNPKPLIITNAVLTFVALFLMVMTRHYLRLVFLEGEFDPTKLDIGTQTGPLAMFLITFVAGLGIVAWMIKKYFGRART